MSTTTRPVDGDSGLRTGEGGVRSGGAYAPPESLAAGKFFVVDVTSPTETRVYIDKDNVPEDPGAGAWLELTVTANPQGDPVTNLDGHVMARLDTTPVDGWTMVRHQQLTPGSWMHYGLFAKYSFGGGPQWRRIATYEVLIPGEFKYAARLFDSLPRWYQDADDDTTEHLAARLLSGFGNEIDITRTWVETLWRVWDPAKVPARLLKPLSETLGLPYERTVGDPRVRKLLSNLMYLRKTKGTREAIEGYLTALSGYRVLAHQGPNIVASVESGEFLYGVGHWVAGSNTAVTRLASPATGNAPPAPQGVLNVERLNTTGAATALGPGGGSVTQMVALDPGTSRQVQMSVNIRTTSSTFNVTLGCDFYQADGTFISTVNGDPVGATTTFGRIRSGWLNVPDTARYVSLRAVSASIAASVGFQIGQVMLADRRWRPAYLPGYVNAEPFSEPGTDRYTGYDFYDAARSVWLNIFPQRTNFAVNSDFTLNNLPSDGWTVVDAPTYGSMPFAYSTYALVASGEDDYADLADGFNSVTPTWTVTFDTANKRLALNSSTSGPRIAQVRSKAFPVLPGAAYSAAMEMRSTQAGTKVTMRMQWMAFDDPNTALVGDDGLPVVTQGGTYDLVIDRNVRVELRNAVAPEGAGYGRLVVESANTVTHTTYGQQALIEDAPVPGSYFNGAVVEGAHGDFGYVGTAEETFSVYYLNYVAVLGSSTNRILTAAPTIVPMHVKNVRLTSAYNGLYDELA